MAESVDELIMEGAGEQDAVDLGDGIFMSKGIASSYLVTTGDGDLLVNTGLPSEAPEIKARFGRVSDGPLRVIVFTQGHPDHVGGWSQFHEPPIETIAQADHRLVREYWRRLQPFYVRRIDTLWGMRTTSSDRQSPPPEPVLTATFVDRHSFRLGERSFELLATPGGETTDALVVWLPESRTVLTGNLMGPFQGHLPNLYTIRGDKYRNARRFIDSIERVMALAPETMITGHEVFRGADEIRARLQRVRDAAEYLFDAVIDGMNGGADLWTLMARIRLPEGLDLPQAHGRVPWIVRSIWEEHVGWFRFESTTELYEVPPDAVWGEIVELAGGPDALAGAARAHVDQGRPLEALHLLDMALSVAPDDRACRRIQIEALQVILEASGRTNFSETGWLQGEIRRAQDAIGEGS